MTTKTTQTNVQTSVVMGTATTISLTPPIIVTIPVNYGKKPKMFLGTDCKRWQQKMLFYLTTLNLAHFLHKDAPTLKDDEINKQVVVVVDALEHDDFLR
ncbi:hypothetical protein ACSBR1_040235 [Camellia fascicularis]